MMTGHQEEPMKKQVPFCKHSSLYDNSIRNPLFNVQRAGMNGEDYTANSSEELLYTDHV